MLSNFKAKFGKSNTPSSNTRSSSNPADSKPFSHASPASVSATSTANPVQTLPLISDNRKSTENLTIEQKNFESNLTVNGCVRDSLLLVVCPETSLAPPSRLSNNDFIQAFLPSSSSNNSISVKLGPLEYKYARKTIKDSGMEIKRVVNIWDWTIGGSSLSGGDAFDQSSLMESMARSTSFTDTLIVHTFDLLHDPVKLILERLDLIETLRFTGQTDNILIWMGNLAGAKLEFNSLDPAYLSGLVKYLMEYGRTKSYNLVCTDYPHSYTSKPNNTSTGSSSQSSTEQSLVRKLVSAFLIPEENGSTARDQVLSTISKSFESLDSVSSSGSLKPFLCIPSSPSSIEGTSSSSTLHSWKRTLLTKSLCNKAANMDKTLGDPYILLAQDRKWDNDRIDKTILQSIV